MTKFFMMVVFLGTIMLWIMMPTLTYKNKWQPYMRLKFGASTYFGATGLHDQQMDLVKQPLIIQLFLSLAHTFVGTSVCIYLQLLK